MKSESARAARHPFAGRRVLAVAVNVLLVGVAVGIVSSVFFAILSERIAGATDRRLADGAALAQVEISGVRGDLLSIASWLAHDEAFLDAVAESRITVIESGLAQALSFEAADSILVAHENGTIIARRHEGQGSPSGESLAGNPGFDRAREGEVTAGVVARGAALWLEVYQPLMAPDGTRGGVMLVESSLGEARLSSLAKRSGAQVTLLTRSGEVMVSAPGPDGEVVPVGPPELGPLLSQPQARAADQERPVILHRDTDRGPVRAFYLPLTSQHGETVGNLAIAQRTRAILGDVPTTFAPVAAVTVVMMLTCGVLGYVSTLRPPGPVRALAAAAARLRDGDLATPIPALTDPGFAPLVLGLEQARVSFRANLETSRHDVTHHAELQRAQEQLLFDAAHELRAPLSSIETALDMAASEFSEMSARELDDLLDRARRTATGCHHLMDGLLSAGSILAGRFAVTPEPTSLRAILDDAAEAVDLMVRKRGQQVHLTTPAPDVDVLVDRCSVVQLLANLLDNASKYGPEGGDIEVRAARQGAWVRVAVADHGDGIPLEHQAGLFERYFRVRRGGGPQGIGLGLGIARSIVEAHHGEIGVHSDPGAGTEVWFTLPASPR